MSQNGYSMNEEEILDKCMEAYENGDLVTAINLISEEKYTIPRDEHEIADIKYTLAVYFYDTYNEEYAMELFDELIAYGKKEYGDTHENTLIYMLRKVACCFALFVDMEESLKTCIFVYNTRAKQLGKNHTSTLTALNWVASFYEKLCDFESALASFKKVYQLRSKTLGKNNDLTLNTLAHIAHLYYNNNNKKKAYEIFKECYELRSIASGKASEKALALKNWMGNCLTDFEDYESALQVFKEIRSDIKTAGVSSLEGHNANAWITHLESLLSYKKQQKFLSKSEANNMLTKAREYDGKYKNFGCSKHRYILNPCLSLNEVEGFETKHKISLPDDFRYFLLHIANGGAGPHYGILPIDKFMIEGRPSTPMHFASDTTLDEWFDIVDYALEREQNEKDFDAYAYMFDGMIGISVQGCGFNAFLCVTGKDRGKVFYTDDTFDTSPASRPCIEFLEWYKCWLHFVSHNNDSGGFDKYLFKKYKFNI